MLQHYFALKLFAALGCAVVAGVFFAFSTFVIKVAQQPPPQGIATMQSINITVINPLFMGAFLGTRRLVSFYLSPRCQSGINLVLFTCSLAAHSILSVL